jgi:hypothetical protein
MIESFQVEHVSVEQGFPYFDDPDNWDTIFTAFSIEGGDDLARAGFHRFDGDHNILDIPKGRGL